MAESAWRDYEIVEGAEEEKGSVAFDIASFVIISDIDIVCL